MDTLSRRVTDELVSHMTLLELRGDALPSKHLPVCEGESCRYWVVVQYCRVPVHSLNLQVTIVVSDVKKSHSSDTAARNIKILIPIEQHKKNRHNQCYRKKKPLVVFDTERLHSIDSLEIKPPKAFVCTPVSQKISTESVKVTSNPPEDIDSALNSNLGEISIPWPPLCSYSGAFCTDMRSVARGINCSINQRQGKQNCPAARLIHPPPSTSPPKCWNIYPVESQTEATSCFSPRRSWCICIWWISV